MHLKLIKIAEYNKMLKKYFTILLIIIISSCQNYSRTAIDKLSEATDYKNYSLKPDVKLYEVDAMGERIIKADWTNQAKKNVEIAMKEF